MKKVLFPSILIATVLAGGLLAYAIFKNAPVSAADFVRSGKTYYEQKRYAEAAIQFMNAVQKDAKNRDARYYLALSDFAQQNLNGAAQQLTKLLEYYPDDTEANLRLGNIYLAVGRADPKYFHEASDIAQKVLSKDPQNVGAFILSGNATAGLQDYRSSA